MESNEECISFVLDKIYFLEENIQIFYKFNTVSLKPKYSDWIALYECTHNINLEKFVVVETELMINSPAKNGLYFITFYANQMKNIRCNIEYQFIYGNKYNEIIGKSQPLHFIHKNDCSLCSTAIALNQNSNKINQYECISQISIDSLFKKIISLENALDNCKKKELEFLSMNNHLNNRVNECEAIVNKINDTLNNLCYTNEPVSIDGSRWMKSCSDFDLKMHFIQSQEFQIQELASKNSCLKKMLEKIEEEPVSINSMVNVECGSIQEPSAATIVYISSDDSDEP
ncbi:uncharacterized protein LOC126910422 [Daktulosphaira vitifoliae]|uniref:uncharacterized protein LOC126910422 n=1 Tax=Daktulosphaira vitifoliae TaxID=58002 RepID=UPI0021AAB7CE|nr:uncharacterized protein LOC126910422 [Daktulosphaira vitifoliae]